MLLTTLYKKKISVRLYPRLAATNKEGLCPVRLTARWHGEELQVDTGEIVLPSHVNKDGDVETLWNGQGVVEGRRLTEPGERYHADPPRYGRQHQCPVDEDGEAGY